MDLLSQYLSYLQSSPSRKKRNNSNAISKEKIIKRSYRLKSKCRGIYFTNLEINCIKLLLKGRTTIEIAAAFDISPNTVKDYIKRVKVKIGYQEKFKLIHHLRTNRITKKNKFLGLFVNSNK